MVKFGGMMKKILGIYVLCVALAVSATGICQNDIAAYFSRAVAGRLTIQILRPPPAGSRGGGAAGIFHGVNGVSARVSIGEYYGFTVGDDIEAWYCSESGLATIRSRDEQMKRNWEVCLAFIAICTLISVLSILSVVNRYCYWS
jgi:hypothetical protein